MTTRKVTESDLSGAENAKRTMFAIGDKWYEIDLTDVERERFEKDFSLYTTAARPVARKRLSAAASKLTRADREVIRKWARKNGFDVQPKGQIPKEIMTEYRTAHNGLLPGE